MERKKNFTLIILGIFLISLISIVLGAPVNPNTGSVSIPGGSSPSTLAGSANQDGIFVSLWKAFFGGIGSFSTGDWKGFLSDKFGIAGSTNTVDFIAFFLLVFLVGMLVYDIAEFLPFFNSGWRRTIFSAIFAVLAFMFFDLTQIKYLLSTYQAVGVTLIVVIPFIVIFVFVNQLNIRAQDEVKPFYIYLGKGIWVFFAVYLLLRFNEAFKVSGSWNPIATSYIVAVVVALVLAWKGDFISAWWHKKAKAEAMTLGIDKGKQEQVDRIRLLIDDKIRLKALAENRGDTGERDRLNKEIQTLTEALQDMM
ncbi:MAG: hypothetical protein Q8N88_01245 [Nanoarchaeota archaeon]|nr:hypothetical protein [Nanoarchaeota archaeon]